MPISDPRPPSTPRPRLHHLRKRAIDPDLVERVERAFDRDQFPQEISRLFDDGVLQGTEVQTVSNEMAPIGAVRYVFEPSIRNRLEGLITEGDEPPQIRPEPKVRLVVTVGWPSVQVAPAGQRSARIKRISGPQGGSPGQTAAEDLRESIGAHTYYLDVDGTQYPIVGIDGTVLQLGTDLRFESTSPGAIYNGASRLSMVAEPDSGEKINDRSQKNITGRPTPVLSGSAMPKSYEVTVKAKDRDQTSRQSETVEAVPSRPAPGRVLGTGYRNGAPTSSPGEESGLNRTMNTLVANLQVPYPESDAVLLGVRYRVANQSGGEWRYEEARFRAFAASALRWMLEEDPDSETRSGLISLGRYSSSQRRRVEVSFIDELGRSVRTVVNEQPTQEEEGGFEAHPGLAKRFATFAEKSAEPADQEVVKFYDKADSKIDPLEGQAESIVENRSLEEVPKEEFKPPNARISTEVIENKHVQISASESGHPNGLDNRYRFDWNSDGSYNTTLGQQATVEHAFESGGTKVIRVEAVDEVDATDTASTTIILPEAKPRVDFDGKSALLDGSESEQDPRFPLQYRAAWKTWDEETSYASGQLVYYEPEQTTYETTTSVSAGTVPVTENDDGSTSVSSGWQEVAFQDSPTFEYQYDNDAEGSFFQAALEVRDDRQARDDTLKKLYIPELKQAHLSASAAGTKATVTIDTPHPDSVNLVYSFYWTGTDEIDAGPIDATEASYNFSDKSTSRTIGVVAETSLGATSEASVTVPFVSVQIDTLDYDQSTSLLSVEASGSTTGAGGLEYRFRVANGEQDFGEWTDWGSAARELSRPPSGDALLINNVTVEAQARDTSGSTATVSQEELLISENGGGGGQEPGDAIDVVTPGQKIRVIGPSGTGPEGYDREYRIDFGADGNYDEWSGNNVREKIITSGGEYQLVFQARSTNPNVPKADRKVYEESATVTFPTAVFTVSQSGAEVSLDASGSLAPGGEPLRYRWDFNNDGTWDTKLSYDSAQMSHKYDDTGTYTIRLEVRNESAAAHTTTKSFTVYRDDFI